MKQKTVWLWGALILCLLTAGASAQVSGGFFPRPAPRAYLCFDGADAGEVMRKANEAGERGWQLVAAAPGRRGSVWCFEQLKAARPNGE